MKVLTTTLYKPIAGFIAILKLSSLNNILDNN